MPLGLYIALLVTPPGAIISSIHFLRRTTRNIYVHVHSPHPVSRSQCFRNAKPFGRFRLYAELRKAFSALEAVLCRRNMRPTRRSSMRSRPGKMVTGRHQSSQGEPRTSCTGSDMMPTRLSKLSKMFITNRQIWTDVEIRYMSKSGDVEIMAMVKLCTGRVQLSTLHQDDGEPIHKFKSSKQFTPETL